MQQESARLRAPVAIQHAD